MTDEINPVENSAKANDASGGTASAEQAQLEAAFTGAANEVPLENAPPAPARKPGQRGPDKGPRKKPWVPVAKMGHRSSETLFTEDPPLTIPVQFENPVPAQDDSALRLGIEGAFQFLETGAVVYVASVCTKAGVSDAVKEKATEGAKPIPEVRKVIIDGGVLCWKKYFPNTPIGPEVMLLGALALWGRQIKEVVDTIKAVAPAQTTPA